MSLQKQCSDCMVMHPISSFYRKESRYESICKECKRAKRRMLQKRKENAVIHEDNKPTELVDAASIDHSKHDHCLVADHEVVTSNDGEIFKEFKYPNGKILRLTKQEWEEVVRYFIWLDKQATLLEKSGRMSADEWVKVNPREVHSN